MRHLLCFSKISFTRWGFFLYARILFSLQCIGHPRSAISNVFWTTPALLVNFIWEAVNWFLRVCSLSAVHYCKWLVMCVPCCSATSSFSFMLSLNSNLLIGRKVANNFNGNDARVRSAANALDRNLNWYWKDFPVLTTDFFDSSFCSAWIIYFGTFASAYAVTLWLDHVPENTIIIFIWFPVLLSIFNTLI
jgi:hypothetical protein